MSDKKASYSERLAYALHHFGFPYVRLAKFLALYPDVIGQKLAAELDGFQDKVDELPLVEVRQLIEEALGKSVDDTFTDISEAVIATSIAQVHKARFVDQNGLIKEVAIKVLKPDLERNFNHALESFYLAVRITEKIFPKSRKLNLACVIAEFEHSVRLDMDLRLVAATAFEMTKNAVGTVNVCVPEIYWDLTRKHMLTTSWVDGIKVSDVCALRDAGYDLQQIASSMIQSFLRYAIRDGFFYIDLPADNLVLDKQGRVVLVNLEYICSLNMDDRYFLAEFLSAIVSNNYLRVSEICFDAGYLPRKSAIGAFALAVCAVCKSVKDKSSFEATSSQLISQFLDYSVVFGITTPAHLRLLQQSILVVEKMARVLDPRLDFYGISEPIVCECIEGDLGISYKLHQIVGNENAIGRLWMKIFAIAGRLDSLSSGFLRMLKEGSQGDYGYVKLVDEVRSANRCSLKLVICLGIAIIILLWFAIV